MNSRTKTPKDEDRGTIRAVEVALLQRLFDQSPDVAFFVKDAKGHYVAVNDSLVARHGLKDKSDVIGKRPCDICPGEYGQIPSAQDARVLRTGRPLMDHLEMHWFRPHKPVWCLTTKLPIRDSQNNVIGLIGFSRDIRVPVKPEDIPSEFAAVLEVFEQDISADVSPAWFAERSNLSPQRLARLTKRLFGLTPSQLITKTRISAASSLLRETDRSIADIAHTCGFYDHSAFTRAFRSTMGVTPTAFRQQ